MTDENQVAGHAAGLAAAGRHVEARDALREGTARNPASAALWWRLALAESALGNAGETLACLERALRAGPREAEDWFRIGWIYLEQWRYEEGERALARAAALAPGRSDILQMLAAARHQSGDVARTSAALEQAAAHAPDDLGAAVALRLQLPLICESMADLQAWRARFAAGLDALHQEMPRWRRDPAQVLELGHENFLLAYHAEDDRELQRGYSSLVARLAAAARPQWREPMRGRWDGARRQRVGFVGSIFRDCTAGRYFERWITGLDPDRFERFVYHTAPIADDFTRRIAAGSEHFATVRLSHEATAARLFDERLDVIVHPEVGMTPLSYLLAALRLAPVQLAGWGHPVTTGSDAIDGYLTCGAMEPDDAASHYVERLLPLPGLGVRYAMPEPVTPLERAALRLPDGSPLYVCPQSLFKIHPGMDAVFAELLARDPQATLLFFQGQSKGATERFGARIQAALRARGLEPRRQVKFAPRLPGEAFRRVLAMSDVVLDTVGWSGGNTTLDAIAAGTPVVTVPGRFMRGRQTAAMLRMMDMDELVAASREEYVERARALAHDAEANRDARKRILERRGALFDRPEPVRALEEILLAEAARSAQ